MSKARRSTGQAAAGNRPSESYVDTKSEINQLTPC